MAKSPKDRPGAHLVPSKVPPEVEEEEWTPSQI
jgi:hypothetical protein